MMVTMMQQSRSPLITNKRYKQIMKKILLLIISSICLFSSFISYANLLISPTRIVFEERQRIAKVIVVNNSEEYKTYRLEWQEKKARTYGGYTDLKSTEVNPSAISGLVRLSPSQIRLAPGERQVIKVALRKPRDLQDKEYRSHLVFKALPNEADKKAGFGIRLDLILSYSIPVIFRKGSTEPVVKFTKVSIEKNKKQPSLAMTLNRSGNFSSFGKIEVFLKEYGSNKERKIAMLNDFSIYPELNKAALSLPLFQGETLAKKGQLRIVYSGLNEYQGVIFNEKTAELKPTGLGVLK